MPPGAARLGIVTAFLQCCLFPEKGRKKFVDRGKCGYYNKVQKVYRVLPEWAGSLKRGEGTTTGYGSDDETGRDCDDTAPKGMRELSGKRTGF